LEEGTLARKRGHEEEDLMDDDEKEDEVEEEEEEDEEDDDEDTIDLDKAEEEEEDDDDVDDDDDEEDDESAELIERRRLFQIEAEEFLENLTMEDVKEVLSENDMDVTWASRLKKHLVDVINEGEVTSMDDAWEEAMERLED
jgi:hypothetical protein